LSEKITIFIHSLQTLMQQEHPGGGGGVQKKITIVGKNS
jgi:hypothetical protein